MFWKGFPQISLTVNAPRFDGFYHDGRYFEACWDDHAVRWSCHTGCEEPLEISMARLWRQKLGTIPFTCPGCQALWIIEIPTMARPLSADIFEASPTPKGKQSLFPH